MSLKTDAKNIYIFSPHVRYGSKDNDWSKFMEKDFTIVMRVKVYPEKMIEDEKGFFLARNGKHAGLSAYIDGSKNVHLGTPYWFWKTEQVEINGKTEFLSPISIEKELTYCMLPEEKDAMNEYIIRCDHKTKKIYYYMNYKPIGEIDYEGLDKCSYKEAYMYLGCATQITETEHHKHVGNFEYEFLMCLDKCLSIEEIDELKNNYKEKYYEDYFGYPKLKQTTPHKENIFFFMDFEHKSNYKLWNSAFNGCFPNFYMKDNTTY